MTASSVAKMLAFIVVAPDLDVVVVVLAGELVSAAAVPPADV